MQTPVSNLRIKDETSTKLELETPNRRWLFLFFVLFFMVLPTLLLVMTIQDGRDQIVGIVMFTIFLFVCMVFLFSVAFRSRLIIHSNLSGISLVRNYWLGFGAFGLERKKSWSFSEISGISISSSGMGKRIEIEANDKKTLALGFSVRRKTDGERSYEVLKNWVEGKPILQPATDEVLDELVQVEQGEKVLKNVERLLYIFGIISLISGGMDLLIVWAIEKNQFDMNMDFLSTGLISFAAGLIYVGCGIGTRKRLEGALWIAMVVVIVERFYGAVQGMANGAELNSSLLFGLLITLFLLSFLWNGIKEIRKPKENPALEIDG